MLGARRSLFIFLLDFICYLWRAEGFVGLDHAHIIAKDPVANNYCPRRRCQVSLSQQQPAEEDSFQLPHRCRKTLNKDTVIVGGGLAGLSTALYLSQLDPQRHITILDREDHEVEAKKKTTISSFAAAGMLAPNSERLPKGMLLDLCLASRRMFPQFCDLVELLARESGKEGAKYLMPCNGSTLLDPWRVGYVASGGFLAPSFAGDTVATWVPPDDGVEARQHGWMRYRFKSSHQTCTPM